LEIRRFGQFDFPARLEVGRHSLKSEYKIVYDGIFFKNRKWYQNFFTKITIFDKISIFDEVSIFDEFSFLDEMSIFWQNLDF